MGFKADVSFLQKLTMGAKATSYALEFMRRHGFDPIVLERYSTSNKIWSTKVKRLRLADVVCVRTGIRVEVRGKSDLQIKMSDAPANPERKWDAPLRPHDLIAFVPCDMVGAGAVVRGDPTFFATRDLQASVAHSRVGQPKSASEGAERDRTWPATIPSEDGIVDAVTADRISTTLSTKRRQTYNISGKVPYVSPGDSFSGGVTFLAGVVPRVTNIRTLVGTQWDPYADLRSEDAGDRYVAAKAIPFRGEPAHQRLRALETALPGEQEFRTRLEIAASAARLGSSLGQTELLQTIWQPSTGAPPYLTMEAVFILSEIPSQWAVDALGSVARATQFAGSELRQAAVWGLGKQGLKAYGSLIEFLDDADGDVVMHAIAGFGSDTPPAAIHELVGTLVHGPSDRRRTGASEALRLIGSRDVALELISAGAASNSPWIPATLGRLPLKVIATVAVPPDLRTAAEPVRLVAEETNWLTSRNAATDFQFLLQQDL